jgi:hypothetical protein
LERRRAQRIKKRVTCEIRVGRDSHRGIVLDVSSTGLFVQTAVRIAHGTVVDVIVHPADGPEFLVRAVVARQKQTDPRLVSVVAAGVGLQILEAPEAYYRDLVGRSEARPGAPKRKHASVSTGTPAAGAGAPELKPFRVQVRKGSRQKTIKLEAADEAAARRAAAAKQGEGWEILEVSDG